MSSSSIEVMSRNDLEISVGGESAPMQSTSSAGSSMQDSDGGGTTGVEMEEMEILEDPGSIIFSPQDIQSRPIARSNRGRKKGVQNRTYSIKLEDGIDNIQNPLQLFCDVCGKIFFNGKSLVDHMAMHSEKDVYCCPYCPKEFFKLQQLHTHLAVHGELKQFHCPVCFQRFTRQDCVKVHMRLHDKSKCVYCEVCQKSFLTIGALNIHQRIHRGEKPFKCHLCGKCFTQKNHLITHIKRHSKLVEDSSIKKLGDRMFQCEYCIRSFIRLSDYERHVQWNHGAVSDIVTKPPLAEVEDTEMFQHSGRSAHLLIDQDYSIQPASSKMNAMNYAPYSSHKVMCTTGTQTDDSEGKVIIPRQYKSMVTTSTQMSAPPTPRALEDDMYESDIYDEGMDRNYSSDEEDDREIGQMDSELMISSTTEDASTSAKNEAFDAVLGKVKQEKKEEEIQKVDTNTEKQNYLDLDKEVSSASSVNNIESMDENEKTNDSDAPESFLEGTLSDEVSSNVSENTAEDAISVITDFPKERTVQEKITPIEKAAINTPTNVIKPSTSMPPPFIKPSTSMPPPPQRSSLVGANKIIQGFNMSNWRGRQKPRARGRAKPKISIGLNGATHLSLIRKSMMTFINEKSEKSDEGKEIINLEEKDPLSFDESSTIGKKRLTKTKQHGKDFICSIKTCEVCNPGVKSNTRVEESPPIASQKLIEKESNLVDDKQRMQSQKLLKFLVSGDAAALVGTNFKLIEDGEVTSEYKKSVGGLINRKMMEKPEYMGDVQDASIVSPPVELQSFCIPTYSCKLCGREFRFEGKLHRHIESVHQRKAIFSPDVKPGRAAALYYNSFSEPSKTLRHVPKVIQQKKKVIPSNPEIEALKSEWDDDGDDDNGAKNVEEPMDEEENMDVEAEETNERPYYIPARVKQLSRRSAGRILQTRGPNLFLDGVKVNINKLAGLASEENVSSIRHEEKKVVKPPLNALDTKCQKLLEKLFDYNLLLRCGLIKEHVSVVLGKVLQHYGVKMIEDYGQGQYEVLKYNLWRLIEWKVTMEQMEEFYTEGKSVEEMMDDIMLGKVPIIAHHEPGSLKTESLPPKQEPPTESASVENEPKSGENSVQSLQTTQVPGNQLMLSQVANVLTGHLNLGEGVTQLVLAQDVSPEFLQGAQIVTIDPATGHVLSQVTADQVILTGAVSEELEQQQTSQSTNETGTTPSVVASLPPGSIVADPNQMVNSSSTMVTVTDSSLDES